MTLNDAHKLLTASNYYSRVSGLLLLGGSGLVANYVQKPFFIRVVPEGFEFKHDGDTRVYAELKDVLAWIQTNIKPLVVSKDGQ